MRFALLVLASCGGATGGGAEWPVGDFLLPDGVHLAHTGLDDPEGPVTWIETTGSSWELRAGDDREDAVVVETLPIVLDDGVTVDGEQLLPAVLSVGKDGVTALGEHETWYGTFPRAVTVEVSGGRWAGTQVFAEGLGPVTYTLDGTVWDLVSYDRDPEG